MNTKNQSRKRSYAVVCLLLCLLLQAPESRGAPNTRLRGSYAVKEEAKSGADVRVMLELSLFNDSNVDLVAVRLTLRDSLLLAKSYGTFEGISIRAGQSTRLRGEFTIPLREYHLWQKGHQPNLFAEFEDRRERSQRVVLGLVPAGGSLSSIFSNNPRKMTTSRLHELVSSTSSSTLINTIAGGGPNNIAALKAGLGIGSSVVADNAGDLYVSDFDEDRVYKIDANGGLSVVAGNGFLGDSGDGGPATAAQLANPYSAIVDAAGNIYIADSGNWKIRKVDSGGNITTLANVNGFPIGLAFASSGDLLVSVADPTHQVQQIDASGKVTTLAGTGTAGYSGDGGPATSAELDGPSGLAVDSSGNILIADSGNNRIRKVDTTGVITTVAGNGTAGYAGDGGPATNAELKEPTGVLVDSSGNMLIADFGNNRARKVISSGVISTIAGNGNAGYGGDGGQATSAQLNAPFEVAMDPNGNLFIADTGNFVIRKVNTSGVISTVAGNGWSVAYPGWTVFPPLWGTFGGDDSAATDAELNVPEGLAVDSAGDVFIADSASSRIRKVSPTGIISTVAGGGSSLGDGGPATSAQLWGATDVAVDNSGNLFIADYGNARVRKVDTNGIITTIAGGNGTLAQPIGVAVDNAGNVFVADRALSRVFKVDSGGTMTLFAGNGTPGYSGDGGPAVDAELQNPVAVAVDSGGNLFISDSENFVIRKVDASGTITTFAGDHAQGFGGDGGPATRAQLYGPGGVAVDAAGNVFIPDGVVGVIRQVDTTGTINTIAGTPNLSCIGCQEFSGDGGPALGAYLSMPNKVAVSSTGDLLYVVDLANNRIREIYPSSAGFILSLSQNGSGTGMVMSSPDGINCGSTCSANFPGGTIVTLYAYPAAGSTFSGWSGPCSGTAACSVSINANQNVVATFAPVGAADFSVASTSSSLDIANGGQGTDLITVAPLNGVPFGSAIQLSCVVSGPAPKPTCSMSPTAVTPGSNSVTSTLTITAPAAAAMLAPAGNQQLSKLLYAFWVPLIFGIAVVGRSRKLVRRNWAFCAVLVLLLILQVACGGNNSSGGGTPPPTNYTVTVSGVSSTITHTTQVTVTVQ